MKNIFILFVLTLFIACQAPATNAVSEENQAKFEQQIEAFKTFTTGFYNEDIDQLMSVVADSVQWSPPQYNGGELLGYEDFKAAGQYYFDNFDEIKDQDNSEDLNNICDECKEEDESVSQNLILTGFKICKSCRVSKTIFPI